MNEISGVNRLLSFPFVLHRTPAVTTHPAARTVSPNARDFVELSELGSLLADLNDNTLPQLSRIVDIRSAIERGDYESDDKLERVIDRVFDELVAPERF